MSHRKNELLIEVELEFMLALWTIGKGTVREISESLLTVNWSHDLSKIKSCLMK